MKVVKADVAGIREAVRVLKQGGVIAYPTETTYGLGCDPRNAAAIRRIFRIKGRSQKKSFLLVAATVAQVKKVAVLSGASVRLARRYWPGPLTLVLQQRSDPRKDIGIRVSSSGIVQKLASRFGYPIVSTSANRSGEVECRSGRAVVTRFSKQANQPDLVIDAGRLPRRKPSTIVRVTASGRLEVLRHGAVRPVVV